MGSTTSRLVPPPTTAGSNPPPVVSATGGDGERIGIGNSSIVLYTGKTAPSDVQNASRVCIDESVKVLRQYAFYELYQLKEVTLCHGLERIAEGRYILT